MFHLIAVTSQGAHSASGTVSWWDFAIEIIRAISSGVEALPCSTCRNSILLVRMLNALDIPMSLDSHCFTSSSEIFPMMNLKSYSAC